MKRIKYVSRFAHPLTPEDIDRIVEASARNNKELDITGILMTSGGMFFQVLEGPAEHVDNLYRTIASDDRHRNVLLLSAEDGIRNRLFPDWSMMKMNLDTEADLRMEPVKAVLSTVVRQREMTQELVESLERALWYELTGR